MDDEWMNTQESSAVVEPHLPQFEVDRWSFPDEAARAEYATALEELRSLARELGVEKLHGRILARPGAAELRAMARSIQESIVEARARRDSQA